MEKSKAPKGLIVDVFRNADGYDCTNNGISSKVKSFVLCGEGIPEIFEADENKPALVLVIRDIFGKEYMHVEPKNIKGETKNIGHFMFGGNFVYSSDSRFPSNYPLAIHDRVETYEEYKRYST